MLGVLPCLRCQSKLSLSVFTQPHWFFSNVQVAAVKRDKLTVYETVAITRRYVLNSGWTRQVLN